MESALTFVILSVTLCIINVDGFYVTSRPVEVSPPQVLSLIQLVTGDIDYRYTDRAKRVTAIKDKDLRSCFVTNYDPQWNLYKSEKESIARRKPFDRVRTPSDFNKLRNKAGKIIAHMCKRVNIYWLNQQQNPPPQMGAHGLLPPPLPIDQSNQQALLPPPQLLPGTGSGNQGAPSGIVPPLSPLSPDSDQNIIPVPERQGQAPPNVHVKDSLAPPLMVPQGQPGNIPPPPDTHHSNQEHKDIETPPPLSVWRQMQHVDEPNVPPLMSGQDIMLEPPKMSDNNFVVPPKVKRENVHDLHEPSQLQNDNVPDLKEPPQMPPQNMLVPIPDFRTPPPPFRPVQP